MAAAGWARPADGYRVVHTYPHDPQAFTQGLVYIDGHLYESTGLNGRSSLRMVDLETGTVQQEFDLPQQYFGEGLAAWGSTLVQLTWQNHVAFVYDRFSFRRLRTIPYPWDGWGLTEDGKSLILSDGTSTLRFLDPSSFHERREIDCEGPRQAHRQAQRTRVRPRRNLRQHLALRPHCAHLASNRRGAWLDRSDRAVARRPNAPIPTPC